MNEHVRLTYKDVGAVTWEVEMTTKRNKKAKYGDKDYDNMYTLYLLDKDRKAIMQSDEQAGYNKSYWSGEKYARFLHTLKKIE